MKRKVQPKEIESISKTQSLSAIGVDNIHDPRETEHQYIYQRNRILKMLQGFQYNVE